MNTYKEKLDVLHCKCFTEARTLEQDIYYNFVDQRTDFHNMVEEVISVHTSANKLMRRFSFGVGTKLSTRIWKGKKRDVFSIFKKVFDKGIKADQTPEEVTQDIKDEVQEFKTVTDPNTGEKKKVPTVTDSDVERLIRTEFSTAININKLLEWKQQGWKTVRHKTRISPASGQKDISFNGRIFKIDYLLTHKEDRIPLHPNCRCLYFQNS